ncbi:MAG: tyrosine-type recombinase/integrase [Solirubrobacteraceae bacterium]
MQAKRIAGTLVYRTRPQRADAPAKVVVFAYWRDSTKTQQMKVIGPAWAEPHGKTKRGGTRWRKRGGKVPDGHFTPDHATERMREIIEQHEVGVADRRTGAGQVTFEQVAWAWHEHGRTVTGWKPSVVRDRRSTLRVHLVPAFGERPVRQLTRDEVRTWWRSLHDPKREGGRLSDRNANKLLSELRAILNWARDEHRLKDDPTEGIRKHRELTSERPDFYSVEEVEALVRHAASDTDALIYRVAAFAGLRRGEIVSLRWRHIDLARGTVHVVDSVSAGDDSRVKDAEGRTVPLAPQLAQALAQWRPDDARDDDLVFPGMRRIRKRDGEMIEKLDGDALSNRYRDARDRAGLRPLRFHDLRHTFGSLAVDGGASLVQVQAWMGHSDIKTTMRYLHSKSRTEDAALLDRAFTADALAQIASTRPVAVVSEAEDGSQR